MPTWGKAPKACMHTKKQKELCGASVQCPVWGQCVAEPKCSRWQTWPSQTASRLIRFLFTFSFYHMLEWIASPSVTNSNINVMMTIVSYVRRLL